MNTFIVSVLCAVHLNPCPIPKGHHGVYQAKDKKECVEQAKSIIAGFGFAAADFSISCREK